MPIQNTRNTYGLLSKIFHWSLIVLIFLQFYFIFWEKYVLPENSPLIGFYIGKLHKPFGMLTFFVVTLAILWRLFTGRPSYPNSMPRWEIKTAKSVHILLYFFILMMSSSGLIMSVAAGRPPNFFGLYQVPMFIQKNEAVSQVFFVIHGISAILLIGLIALHVLAAFKHHFIDKDQILRRMLF